MSNWYVGQKVVYVTGKNMPKNSEHIILGLQTFSCGCVAFDIGTRRNRHLNISVCDCLNVLPYNGCEWESTSFRPLLTDSIEFAERELEKVSLYIEERELIINN
jgi:hypothetical protein